MHSLLLKFFPDNFTDLARTPWAGTRIASSLKKDLSIALPQRIGESWEFSTCPTLPSRCCGTYTGTLSQLLSDPTAAHVWLSQAHIKTWGHHSPLLLKCIDADADLSLQLHPPIDAAHLPDNASGKWEAWLILSHAENAGFYLGLKKGVTREQFTDALYKGNDIKPLLHFVRVRTGEVYSIAPKTVHALGAGICVLEPQIIHPGKHPVSLRLHDWNRCYDQNGYPDANGKPRTLNIDEAISYIDFDAPREDELTQQCRTTPHVVRHLNQLTIAEMAPIPCMLTRLFHGTGDYEIESLGDIASIFVLQGNVQIDIASESYALHKGESGVIAASAKNILLHCSHTLLAVTYCIPELYHAVMEPR